MAEIDIQREELTTDPIDVTIAGETRRISGGWTYLGHPTRFVEAAAHGRRVKLERGRRSRFDRRNPE